MDITPVLAPQATTHSFKIPRKSIAVGYQPVLNVSELKSQQYDSSEKEDPSTAGETSGFHRSLSSMSYIPYAPIEEQHSKKRNLLEHGWYAEGMAIAITFLCTAAVIGILVIMDNKPLSHWDFIISLNATVATLITAAQSTAIFSVTSCQSQSKWLHFKKSARKLQEFDLFEDASRGPWGSLMVLLRVRWKLGFIAGAGAMATVLALGIYTTAQQLVGLNSRQVEVDHNAAFGLSYIYDGGAQFDPASSSSLFYPKGVSSPFHNIGCLFTRVKASTADAGMQGAIYKGIFNIKTPAVFNCSSTCVWGGTHVSLGFSSACSDVTSKTTIKKNPTYHEVVEGYDLTTPQGVTVTANYTESDWQAIVTVAAVDLADSLLNYTSSGIMVAAEFLRVGIVISPVTNGDNAIEPDKVQVFECTVGFSGFRYTNASASGNQFTVDSQDLVTLNPGLYVGSDLYNPTVVFNQTDLPVMMVKAADIGALTQFFMSDRISGAIYDGESVPAQTGIGVALRSANITEAFNNMALSMTDQLRSSYNVTAAGSTLNSVPFVHVQWLWLSFTLFVQMVSGLILALTIFSSRNLHVRLWKSSTLAVLYHDVVLRGDSVGVLRTDIQTPEQMQKLSKRTKALIE
jgi:hypothetical protein